MEKYNTVLQLCVILSILFFIFLFYKFIVSLIKKDRLSYYSINLEKEEYINSSFVIIVIRKFSKFLKSLVIFNGLGRSYDKYLVNDGKFKSGLDYVSLKILLGLTFMLFYLFVSFLYKNNITTLIMAITFILGFILVDFYCFYLDSKNNKIKNKDIMIAITIMNNSYRVNRSNKQVIEDVINRSVGVIQNEFKKVLNDINIGMTLEEAFKRVYNRTKNKTFLDISMMFSLNKIVGANKVDILDNIEKKLVSEEKIEEELNVIKSTNKLAFFVFLILPLVFIIYLISFDKAYLNLIISTNGIIVVLILAIIYLMYVLIIYRVVRGKYL